VKILQKVLGGATFFDSHCIYICRSPFHVIITLELYTYKKWSNFGIWNL